LGLPSDYRSHSEYSEESGVKNLEVGFLRNTRVLPNKNSITLLSLLTMLKGGAAYTISLSYEVCCYLDLPFCFSKKV